MHDSAFVGEEPLKLGRLIGRAIPDHVHAPMTGPQVVIGTGDRITQKLFAGRQAERHAPEHRAMDVLGQ